jgi:hypothetical protein
VRDEKETNEEEGCLQEAEELIINSNSSRKVY